MSGRHGIEAEVNHRTVCESKKLLSDVYASFYDRIEREIATLPGCIVELGSGIGNVAGQVPGAICSDRFVSPGLDIAVDANLRLIASTRPSRTFRYSSARAVS